MFQYTEDDILRKAKNKEVDFVDLQFTNLFGGLHHVTVPASYLSEKTFRKGVGIDGSSIPGFKSVSSGDMAIKPDAATAYLDPFAKYKTLSILCDICEIDTDSQAPGDPRGVARNAEKYISTIIPNGGSKWGPELEFYLFNEVTFGSFPDSAFYRLNAPDAQNNYEDNTSDYPPPFLRTNMGYHACKPADKGFDIRSEMVNILEQIGVPIKYHHHEVGGFGQHEIEPKMMDMMQSADNVQRMKYIIKNVANKHGLTATFMPKPLFGQAGSGMHFHTFLVDPKGISLFYNDNVSHKMSDIMLNFIAGLMKHARALCAFTNPSTNSYKRLVPGYEAPVYVAYGVANRTVMIRIPKYASTPDAQRFELRTPDATCNAYLVQAAIIMAGMDGVKQKLIAPEPESRDLFELSKDELAVFDTLPSNLNEAIDALRDDMDFLMASNVFPKAMLEGWMEYKYEVEFKKLSTRPHPFEFELYLDC